ncbi:MAG: hypothetical protein ACK40G_06640 [Cytophagaceae bacterium]
MRKNLLIFLILGFFMSSCEDDPIVEPATDTGGSKGSYGRLSFPDSTKTNQFNPLSF